MSYSTLNGSIIECAHCSYACDRSDRMKKHFLTVHQNERPFSCDKCDKTFKVKDKRDLHVNTVWIFRRIKSFCILLALIHFLRELKITLKTMRTNCFKKLQGTFSHSFSFFLGLVISVTMYLKFLDAIYLKFQTFTNFLRQFLKILSKFLLKITSTSLKKLSEHNLFVFWI